MTTAATPGAAADTAAANLRGLAWMVLTGLLFVSFTGIIRHLGTDMNPLQAAFIRYSFGVLLLAPVFVRLIAARRRPRRLHIHALRGFIHGFGVMLWFYAMTRISIAEVTALGFTAPIFTTVGAALFLGERLHVRRIGAVLVGFGGAMVILKPGVEVIDLGAVAQLVAAPLFATSFIVTKKLTDTESNAAIVAFLALFVTLTLMPPALAVWRPPRWDEVAWLFLAAVIATLGHLCLTQAFRTAQVTVVQPAIFLQLVWATLLGLYVFGEEPDLWTWIGGALIVASATYIAHREARLSRPIRSKVRADLE